MLAQFARGAAVAGEIVGMIEQDPRIERLAPDFARPEPAPIAPERLADYRARLHAAGIAHGLSHYGGTVDVPRLDAGPCHQRQRQGLRSRRARRSGRQGDRRRSRCGRRGAGRQGRAAAAAHRRTLVAAARPTLKAHASLTRGAAPQRRLFILSGDGADACPARVLWQFNSRLNRRSCQKPGIENDQRDHRGEG